MKFSFQQKPTTLPGTPFDGAGYDIMVDGVPLKMVQGIKFSLLASDMIPHVEIDVVPQNLFLDLESGITVNLAPLVSILKHLHELKLLTEDQPGYTELVTTLKEIFPCE